MRDYNEGFLIAIKSNVELLLNCWVEPVNITPHYRSWLFGHAQGNLLKCLPYNIVDKMAKGPQGIYYTHQNHTQSNLGKILLIPKQSLRS